MSKRLRVASDVGGTFTDLVWCEIDSNTGAAGPVHSVKADTTPPDFEEGVLNCLKKAAVDLGTVGFLAHGSTVVINALTERKGAVTGLVTTAGFRDVLEIARGNRPDLFNFNFRKPAPFVERHLRREIHERTNVAGEVVREPELSDLYSAMAHFRAEGVAAVAICFLHAYANPANEQAVATWLRSLMPEASIIASHEISREWREYERTSTTVLSAYVAPVVERYLGALQSKLAALGLKGSPYIMQSNGGVATVSAVRRNPITMVESGPASGIFAAAALGRLIDEPDLLVLDIGGTTAKCALVEGGEVKVATDYYIDRDRRRPGYPIQTPVAEIVEIGNGGGSIAWIDDGGKLHVGPKSAGARPGPAAYGRGGADPTTTDANLLLGRIDPDLFVGGEVQPDWDAIDRAFAPLAERLGMDKVEVAGGIVRIANANMVNALRLVSTNKGYDPRDFALMVCGGGGAMHGVALAEELGVRRVIVPVNSSAFSAWGMLLSDLRRDYLRTRLIDLDENSHEAVEALFADLEQGAVSDFAEDGAEDEPWFERFADMRYLGQEHTVKVPLAGSGGIAGLIERFHVLHEKRYTYRLDGHVQLVNAHLVARVEVAKPELRERASTGAALADARLGSRPVVFDRHGSHESEIYDGLQLEAGMTFAGPAVVQEASATLVVPPGCRVSVDRYGNYHVHLGAPEKRA
ncbi:hydantoinase/oxoprolinase family protein [Sphingosinicella terrae]|uniref:hydantoinase/oxoprolinase family protein n=1 Tax=Sphingosinicella terrae TaxID=2172047 RepID=UPI000E0DF510|nr:hydantoinase/oxoprolinase family protein [Sphingosinicella terrae]